MSSKSRRKAIIRRRIFIIVCLIVLTALITGIVLIISHIKSNNRSANSSDISSVSSETVSSKEKTDKKEPKLVSSATVINTGDIMVHSTQLDGAKRGDGQYDFSDFFKNIKNHIKNSDLAVANLEVTFGG
ncbi:MAG: CapA family protein, partial [Clostridia bacterium]|nr:CapA family protein [Clostridia bacterium]